MSENSEHHIVPVRVYVLVFLTLIVMTWVTAFVSTIDLGRMNVFVALSIAIFKASLVILFFMHVKYTSEKLTKIVIVSAIFWLFLLLALSMADYATRLLS